MSSEKVKAQVFCSQAECLQLVQAEVGSDNEVGGGYSYNIPYPAKHQYQFWPISSEGDHLAH